jgi:peroxiredoxin
MKVPYTNFKSYTSEEWKEMDTEQIFPNKKIVVFGIPGAFTPNATAKQIQDYDDKYNKFKDAGIDEVYCLSVNDSLVMDAYFKDLGIKNVKAIGDGEGVFTQGIGMLVNKPKQGFGMRSWRYSMLVDNSEVKNIFEEPGRNNAGDDEDPFEKSDADAMLEYIGGQT